MNARYTQPLLLLALLTPTTAATAPPAPLPNDLYASTPLTFVVGTLGDDASDRIVSSQVALVRSLFFPQAAVVADTTITGATARDWPQHAIVYGGQHVNRLIAATASCLPLRIDRDVIEIGERKLTGPEYQVIALIPADERDGACRHPDFLLLAGAGSPGVEEINSLRHGAHQVEIADRFGPWLSGRWEGQGEATHFVTEVERPRLTWNREPLRGVQPGAPGFGATVNYPSIVPPWNDVKLVHEAIARGLAQAAARLGVETGTPGVYVYPDYGSIQSLTGKRVDAWTAVAAQVIHVTVPAQFDPERLALTIAHEATHLFAPRAAGQAASPLMGEGLAVWVSGHYGGVPLDEHAKQMGFEATDLTRELGAEFSKHPESETYPLAGLLVGQLVDAYGLPAVLRDFYGTPPAEWTDGAGRRDVLEAQCAALAQRLKGAR